VVRRFDLGGSLAHQALVAGEIDVYVEYTGTALMAILKAPPMTDPAAVRAKVEAEYATRFGLAWTEPLGFDNTFAILVRGEDARREHLRTISDAARLAPGWRAGFGPDFMVRADGYAAFAKAYHLAFAAPPREMDLALTYRALRDGQVDLVAGNATDGMIARYGLVQLADDRRFFPPYDAAPVVRREVLARPAVREALAALGGRVDVADMRALNDAVDAKGEAPRAAVAAFLKREGLVP
jgi:glycine betaine/choline ABC-type transport system substrate-binding protein